MIGWVCVEAQTEGRGPTREGDSRSVPIFLAAGLVLGGRRMRWQQRVIRANEPNSPDPGIRHMRLRF
jgi:hypothetical protein